MKYCTSSTSKKENRFIQQYSICTLHVNKNGCTLYVNMVQLLMSGQLLIQHACSAEGSLYSQLCQLKLEDVCLFAKTAASEYSIIHMDC